MIEFQKIRWKNFLSTGNNFTEIILNKSSSTLIIGGNGAGKSTILDALTFGLFGKPFRKINKPQLLNSINEKDCLIEIDFRIGKKQYLIRRGIKPTIFEVYINDKLVDQDSKSLDYQRYLEENILKLNFKSFTQTVILGSATFVPFMQLSATDRRDIIEDLLDIKIFSSMNEILKVKLAELKDELLLVDKDNDVLEQKVHMLEIYIEDSTNNNNAAIDQIKQKIEKNNDQINILNDEISSITEEIGLLEKSIVDVKAVKKKQNKLDGLESQLGSTKKKHKSDINWFNEIHSCPTCKQDINEHHKKCMIEDKESKIGQIEDALQNLSAEFKKVNDRLNEISEVNEKISELNAQSRDKSTTIKLLNTSIKDLTDELSVLQNGENSTEKYKKELKKHKDKLLKIKTKKEELITKREYYNVSSLLLKDTGVKTSIVKYYLPKMNKLVNKYLQDMGFYINFTMNEKFAEMIKSRGRENFSYSSFSEGEKMRIDLALLFTWRAIAKMKNSVNTNLLILDEVFDSSLDTNGTDEFLKLLNTLGGNNVFVISHKGEILYDKFHSVIKFDKIKNFSQIASEK